MVWDALAGLIVGLLFGLLGPRIPLAILRRLGLEHEIDLLRRPRVVARVTRSRRARSGHVARADTCRTSDPATGPSLCRAPEHRPSCGSAVAGKKARAPQAAGAER